MKCHHCGANIEPIKSDSSGLGGIILKSDSSGLIALYIFCQPKCLTDCFSMEEIIRILRG